MSKAKASLDDIWRDHTLNEIKALNDLMEIWEENNPLNDPLEDPSEGSTNPAAERCFFLGHFKD